MPPKQESLLELDRLLGREPAQESEPIAAPQGNLTVPLGQASQPDLASLSELDRIVGAAQKAPMPSANPAASPSQSGFQISPEVFPPDMQAFLGLTPKKMEGGSLRSLRDMGASGAGEFIGRRAGMAMGGPVGSALGGATGAVAGLITSRLASGEDITASDIALEFGTSLVPDFIAAPLVAGGRKLLSRMESGRQVSRVLGNQELKKIPARVMRPVSEDEVEFLMNVVRNSDTRIAPDVLRFGVKKLSKREISMIKSTLLNIGPGPRNQYNLVGEGMVRQIDAMIKGDAVTPGMDLGALTHIRSQIDGLIAALSASTRPQAVGARKAALGKFSDLLTETIENGKIVKGGGVVHQGQTARQVLEVARKITSNIKSYDEVVKAIGEIAGMNANGDLTLHMGKFAQLLADPKGKTQIAASKVIEKNKLLKFELEAFQKVMQRIDIRTSTSDRLQIINYLATIFSSASARERFYRLALHKRGKMTMEEISGLGINTLRRMGLGQPQGSEPVFP